LPPVPVGFTCPGRIRNHYDLIGPIPNARGDLQIRFASGISFPSVTRKDGGRGQGRPRRPLHHPGNEHLLSCSSPFAVLMVQQEEEAEEEEEEEEEAWRQSGAGKYLR